jgi:hypothetical protein
MSPIGGTWSKTDAGGKESQLTMIAPGTVTAFANGDTTPSVVNGNVFKTANTATTVITDFDGYVEGQEITVLINDDYTEIDFSSAALQGNVKQKWRPTTGDVLKATVVSDVWYCQLYKSQEVIYP